MSVTFRAREHGPHYQWLRGGDLNAFFGLMIDNISGMILMTSLLVGFGLPRDFVLGRMIPGTAVGVLVGDLIFTVMAFRLARRTGRSDVTAMPLGLDTPSTFGSVILIIGPAFQAAIGRGLTVEAAAQHAWFLGVAMLLASGIFKLVCACSAAGSAQRCRGPVFWARWRPLRWRSSAFFPCLTLPFIPWPAAWRW